MVFRDSSNLLASSLLLKFFPVSSRILAVNSLLIFDISFAQLSSLFFQFSSKLLMLILRLELIDFSKRIIFYLLSIYFCRLTERFYCYLMRFLRSAKKTINFSSFSKDSVEVYFNSPLFFPIISLISRLRSFSIFSFSSLTAIIFLFIYCSRSSLMECLLCSSLSSLLMLRLFI